MNTPITNTPKDVFLHLLHISMLYVSVVSFITLFFQYINYMFPDQLNFYLMGILDSIHLSSASLAISFPVYLLSTWMIEKDFMSFPEKREFAIRKWLVNLTLFIASITIIVDLITLIYTYFNGELTMRFFLKVALVLAIAAVVFGYYIWDMRIKDEIKTVRMQIKLGAVSLLVVLATIAYGFILVGSPEQQRARRFDDQRVQDLQGIQNEIVNYWQQKEVLPQSLDALTNSISGYSAPKDPRTNELYEYAVSGALTFQLCSNFEASTAGQSDQRIYKHGPYGQNWNHAVGRVCFPKEIDPELYKTAKRGEMLPIDYVRPPAVAQ
ncbi:MAG: hypothetical protein HYV65_00085 [Candidatus Spechtbacteria bacterium]|nr:hypothetical protein [Candidatus Spechtbacteria bacterium]